MWENMYMISSVLLWEDHHDIIGAVVWRAMMSSVMFWTKSHDAISGVKREDSHLCHFCVARVESWCHLWCCEIKNDIVGAVVRVRTMAPSLLLWEKWHDIVTGVVYGETWYHQSGCQIQPCYNPFPVYGEYRRTKIFQGLLCSIWMVATMDKITIKTPNPKCRLSYFRPLLWTSAPLTFSLVHLPPPPTSFPGVNKYRGMYLYSV
jgi:hypothetical protein